MINEIIKVNSKYTERVNSFIKENKLFIKPSFKPIFVGDLINWKITVELSKTEMIYLHSLLIVKDLIKYKLTNDNDFSEIARKIIEKWWEDNQENMLAWNEHAVAERTLNLIYFQKNSTNEINQEKFHTILMRHLEFLSNSRNYKNNNHGLMMDRSLLIGSDYINNITYREQAINRFTIFIYRDFSKEGIHLENSPEYHSLALKISLEFIYILKEMNIELSKDIMNIIKKAELYLPRISRPDKSIPIMGDSGHKNITTHKSYGNIVDHTSGIFLYQDSYNYNWLLVSNGYQSLTHKHKDDMSIQFSINNFNILADSGKYNYDKSSTIRKYLISDKAHSKPYIIERKFRYDGKERLKTNIILNSEKLYHIETSYMKPRDFHIIRNVILHKDTSSLIIIDRFSSKEKLTYVSNFVFDPKIDIGYSENHNLEILNTNYIMVSHNNNISLVSKKNEIDNWYSPTFNQIIKTNRAFVRSSGTFKTHIISLRSNALKIAANVTSDSINLDLNCENFRINISKIESW